MMIEQRDLQIIYTYEKSVARHPGCVSYDGKRFIPHDPAFNYSFYARKCAQYLTFGKQVDQVINGDSVPISHSVLVRPNTPALLQSLGFADLPMLHTYRHLRDELHPKSDANSHWHGLTGEQVKAIPELLETPVIVMESLNGSGAIVCVLDIYDQDRAPIILPFKKSGQGFYQGQEILSNFILSIYGKSGIEQYIQRAIDQQKLLYVDQEKIRGFASLSLLQLLGTFANPAPSIALSSQASQSFYRPTSRQELAEAINDKSLNRVGQDKKSLLREQRKNR
ncbi:hypothetical protein [Arcanobacterium bovis]|uniref:Phage MuF C-terminal domain-containing protein n=1 Tax=Arcanobacterium bovis TaxID=2529275 RepID=A0A4V2KR04_9ACTO|nr:hypothetical protein [Arcanobacterium bovis]TBW20713.1 hypothetical protein EZJ44_08460 [Arcanobacterium bovis]